MVRSRMVFGSSIVIALLTLWSFNLSAGAQTTCLLLNTTEVVNGLITEETSLRESAGSGPVVTHAEQFARILVVDSECIGGVQWLQVQPVFNNEDQLAGWVSSEAVALQSPVVELTGVSQYNDLCEVQPDAFEVRTRQSFSDPFLHMLQIPVSITPDAHLSFFFNGVNVTDKVAVLGESEDKKSVFDVDSSWVLGRSTRSGLGGLVGNDVPPWTEPTAWSIVGLCSDFQQPEPEVELHITTI